MACRNFIVPMDLEFFMPPEKIAQALKVLDVDGDGKISLADMRDAVIQVLILDVPHKSMHAQGMLAANSTNDLSEFAGCTQDAADCYVRV